MIRKCRNLKINLRYPKSTSFSAFPVNSGTCFIYLFLKFLFPLNRISLAHNTFISSLICKIHRVQRWGTRAGSYQSVTETSISLHLHEVYTRQHCCKLLFLYFAWCLNIWPKQSNGSFSNIKTNEPWKEIPPMILVVWVPAWNTKDWIWS